MKLNLKPVPQLPPDDLDALATIPIVPSESPLYPLSLAPEKILVRSAYHAARMDDALPECYARKEVQQRLFAAADMLPSNLRLVILDGWRSTALQRALFDQCRRYYYSLHPEADETVIHTMAAKFVAIPSRDPQAPSPHLTGGAIDLTLADRNGRPLFFGAKFDFAGEISWTRHFENAREAGEKLTAQEEEALYNRRLLYHVMVAAGFANYDHEWWHFEYGTQRWAQVYGKDEAFYGPVHLTLQSFEIPIGKE